MSVYTDISGQTKPYIDQIIQKQYNWIHNNPSATGNEAQTAMDAWVALQPWDSMTTQVLTYLVTRFGGGWAAFRDYVLTLSSEDVGEVMFQEDTEEAQDTSGIRSEAEQIRDALLFAGSVPVVVRFDDSIEYRNNFVESETVTGTINGTPYTVRQLSDPQYDGQRTDPNPLGWELI